jgi:hypothetical protein
MLPSVDLDFGSLSDTCFIYIHRAHHLHLVAEGLSRVERETKKIFKKAK